MRLFIALPLPLQVREALAAAQERLRSGHFPVRWTNVEGLHLTLQFLGESESALVSPLIDGLSALETSSIHLMLGGLGAFPDLQRPRVIWAGVGGDLAALDRLRTAVLTVTTGLGFPADPRPFTPHLTLGRLRNDARPDQVRALALALRAAAPLPALTWEAGRPILYQSTLTREGAIYTALGPGAG